jgi:hypothetical protein
MGSIVIQPYTQQWEPAVRDFNARLAPQRGPVRFQFPEGHATTWPAWGDGCRVSQEFFVAVEDGSAVRGGYVLKMQEFWAGGRTRPVGNLQLPLSEGLVDPTYRFVGVQLVMNAQRRQPSLYSLGLGGLHNPYPRLLKGLGWSLVLVPFFFRVARPSRFFRRLAYLRTSPARRLAADLLAWTGAGWAGVTVAQALAGRPSRAGSCRVEPAEGFGDWADEVWGASRADYALTAVRDRATLEALYIHDYAPGLIVLKVSRGPKVVGWAAVLDTAMKGHRYFGDLRVGSIVDGFAAAGDVAGVVAGAARFLEGRGVDLIVSNQSHLAWRAGLKAAGFLTGPSNFALALSKPLAAEFAPMEGRYGEFHFNRGDGDGPINL